MANKDPFAAADPAFWAAAPPITQLQSFWERAALSAISSILGERDAKIAEAATIAAEFADLLASEWLARFESKWHARYGELAGKVDGKG